MAATREERLSRAEAFLQEAVFRSRGAQAGAGLFAVGDPARGDCGLGARAAVVLDLSPKAEELFDELWPEGLGDAQVEALREVMRDWIERQDALDRKRNHFLKAFRNEHGFDRSAYSAEQQAAYRTGLDEVNAECNAERRAAAERALERTAPRPGSGS